VQDTRPQKCQRFAPGAAIPEYLPGRTAPHHGGEEDKDDEIIKLQRPAKCSKVSVL
jgi:hypothetical protein